MRRGGLTLTLYAHSLSIALFVLFALSFLGHAAMARTSITMSTRATAKRPSPVRTWAPRASGSSHPELAERILSSGDSGGVVDLVAGARVAGVQTGPPRTCRNGSVRAQNAVQAGRECQDRQWVGRAGHVEWQRASALHLRG